MGDSGQTGQQLEEANRRVLSYLAIPYTHRFESVRKQRFKIANVIASFLMEQGILVFSPISHTHPIAFECDLACGWDYWEAFDRAYLSMCKDLYVVCIEGWTQSKGVQAEIQIAKEMNLPINLIPDDYVQAILKKHARTKKARQHKG